MRSLINRFKEFNRTPKEKHRLNTGGGSPSNYVAKPKSPGITRSIVKPTIPPGEDAVSYERHIKAMQMEFKKSHRNNRVVGESCLFLTSLNTTCVSCNV